MILRMSLFENTNYLALEIRVLQGVGNGKNIIRF